jgi:uncharacterized protein YndB with AHSA1/START domain
MPPPLEIERTVVIQAPPERVMAAFFDPHDLDKWWQVIRSVTVPRPLGTYAVEWAPTPFRDEVLGPLGGAFHGTIMEYRPGVELFVADAYWQPPEGEPIGPMALEIRCSPMETPNVTKVVVRQRGDNDGPRWRRYFEVVSAGWQRALGELKTHLDREHARDTTTL